MRRRSSTGEEGAERLEKLRMARLRAESDACKSPRQPTSISTDTLPAAFKSDLDKFRGEWIAGLDAQRSSTALSPISSVGGDCDTPPPAVRLGDGEAGGDPGSHMFLNMPRPAQPIKIARPNTLTRGSAGAAKDPKEQKRRRGSSVVVPGQREIAEAMGETPTAVRPPPAHADVEFISPFSPRAAGGDGDVLDIDVDSTLTSPQHAAAPPARPPQAPGRKPSPISTKRSVSPNPDEKCVVS